MMNSIQKYQTLVWLESLEELKITLILIGLLGHSKYIFFIHYLKKIIGESRLTFECSGYMSPEYAMQGLFSEKSDVFSFGVLLLEIVSGRRNSSFYDDEHSLTLLGFVSHNNF